MAPALGVNQIKVPGAGRQSAQGQDARRKLSGNDSDRAERPHEPNSKNGTVMILSDQRTPNGALLSQDVLELSSPFRNYAASSLRAELPCDFSLTRAIISTKRSWTIFSPARF